MNRIHSGLGLVLSFLAAFALLPAQAQTTEEVESVELADIVGTYADLAQAGFEDALRTAEELRTAIELLLEDPTEDNLDAARTAWKIARIPYLQTEVFRFADPEVDAWEGRVNAWPVDEGLIDYVGADYGTASENNPLYTANVIANLELEIDGETLSVPHITQEILVTLHGAADTKTNVASGYHAIEFLLWGTDDNGPAEILEGEELLSGGTRPATDFGMEDCTNGNCDRRGEYLFSAINLLISDLEEMVGSWQVTGMSRRGITDDTQAGLVAMLTGMASLSYGELAGEHMKLGLLLHDAEWEQDDFSDYTYASHLFDARGVVNVYFGEYFAMDSSVVSGPSLSEYLSQNDASLDDEMRTKLAVTMARMRLLVNRARATENYDQMIIAGNERGNDIIQAAIDGLLDQSRTIEKIAGLLGIDQLSIKGSDSLDNPKAVLP